MLRLGLGLGPLARQPSVLRPFLLCSPISNTLQSRTYAKAVAKAPEKKVKSKEEDDDRVKVRKVRVKSGARLKRISWLDTPRKPKNPPQTKPKPPHRVTTKNSIRNNIIRLQARTGKMDKSWIKQLARKVNITVESAEMLTDYVLRKDEDKPSALYTHLLDLWYRRKNVERATQVFEAMKKDKKDLDSSYSIYCKILATRGDLPKAKEILAERLALQIKGSQTLATMVYYIAADDFSAAETLLNSDLPSNVKFPMTPHDLLSAMIGWALKNGELEIASKHYKELKEYYRILKSKGIVFVQPRSLEYDRRKASSIRTKRQYRRAVEVYNQRLVEYHKFQEQRHTALTEWSKNLRQANNNWKENLTTSELNKLVHKEGTRKPRLPGGTRRPEPPSKPQLPLKPKPPQPAPTYKGIYMAIDPRVLRPLIDMEQDGKEIPELWRGRLKRGLDNSFATSAIQGLARKIHCNDKVRYEHLQNLLKKLGLNATKLTLIIPPRVKGPTPGKRAKTPEVTKWWKKDRTVFEQKEGD